MISRLMTFKCLRRHLLLSRFRLILFLISISKTRIFVCVTLCLAMSDDFHDIMGTIMIGSMHVRGSLPIYARQ